MSTTLYRKYRPQAFDDLTGQEHVVTTLQNQYKQGKLAHAYIFTGPRGVGKTTTARLLAALVNNVSGTDAKAIFEGKDIDVIEIDAASHTGVDSVRENIIEQSRFAPHRLAYKVFIIDEVHMLSTSAFNALLKLLEEPPRNTLFILATTELHKVPATIISRCQRFVFKKITLTDIVTKLEKIIAIEEKQVERDVLVDIARIADGGMRDAESLLGQVLALGVSDAKITRDIASLLLPNSFMQQALELLSFLVARDTKNSLMYFTQLTATGADMMQFSKDFIEVARLAVLAKTAPDHDALVTETNKDFITQLQTATKDAQVATLVKIIDTFAKRRLEVKFSTIASLPFELAILELTNQESGVRDNKQMSKQAVEQRTEERRMENEGSLKSESSSLKAKSYNLPPKADQPPAETPSSSQQPTTNNLQPTTEECTLTLGQVKAGWQAVLNEAQKTNPSIVLILKTSEPTQLVNGVLTIGYKYSFNKDRMATPNAHDILAASFRAVFNQCPKIEGIVLPQGYNSDFIKKVSDSDEVELVMDNATPVTQASVAKAVAESNPAVQTTQDKKHSDDLVATLVKAFGGKVVG